jgi:hypothetical protein
VLTIGQIQDPEQSKLIGSDVLSAYWPIQSPLAQLGFALEILIEITPVPFEDIKDSYTFGE